MNRSALIAEFIGTFALIFVGVGAIAANAINGGDSGLVGIALAHGLVIAVMITATMAVSGGHLNPAVTVGLLVIKKISLGPAIGYIIAQCLGGIVAALLLTFIVPGEILASVSMGIPALAEGVSAQQGILLEAILAFFVVFVVCCTAVDSRAPKVGGLFIGLTVALDILVGGPITGGAMNPARHLGPALVSSNYSEIWIYWVGPILGGIVATLVYSKCMENSD